MGHLFGLPCQTFRKQRSKLNSLSLTLYWSHRCVWHAGPESIDVITPLLYVWVMTARDTLLVYKDGRLCKFEIGQ